MRMDPHADHSTEAVLRRAIDTFVEQFDADPELAARAPGRVNLIGEHTDYNDGFVLPMAIDRDTVIVARINHSQRCRLAAADLDGEIAAFMNDPALAPGRTRWANYVKGVIARFTANGQPVPSFDAAIASAIPLGAGLSSSAALEVAAATLIESLIGIRLDPARKAQWCRAAEHEFVGVPCGIMDQLVSAAAIAGHALLIDCRSLHTRAVHLAAAESPLIAWLVTDSGVRHELADPDSSGYADRRRQCERAVAVLRESNPAVRALRDVHLNDLERSRDRLDEAVFRRARHVILENQRVGMVAEALEAGRYETAGFLMNESHRSCRDDYEVSCPELDLLADLAQRFEGVYGSRMTGGGFGGSTVTLVRADAVDALAAHLRNEYHRRTGRKAACFTIAASEGARGMALGGV